MYKQILFISMFTLLLIFLGISGLFAQPNIVGNTVEVSKYENTLTKVEAYYDTGDYAGQWYEAFSGSGSVDIAAANAGQQAGSFLTGASLPNGHISQIRLTISSSFAIKAIVSYGGSTYYSTASGGVSTDSSQYAESSVTIRDANGNPVTELTETKATDVTISEGTTVTVKMAFNLLSTNADETTGCVGISNQGGSYVIAPRQPSVTEEVTYT